jgi:hypothetical protein
LVTWETGKTTDKFDFEWWGSFRKMHVFLRNVLKFRVSLSSGKDMSHPVITKMISNHLTPNDEYSIYHVRQQRILISRSPTLLSYGPPENIYILKAH